MKTHVSAQLVALIYRKLKQWETMMARMAEVFHSSGTRPATPFHSRSVRRIAALTFALALPAGALLTVGPAEMAGAQTVDVTNCSDSGPGSLRDAVTTATSGEVIGFALSPSCSLITETSGRITIRTNLTLDGPGASALAVSGDKADTAFVVDNVTANISGLTIDDGSACDGGGIDNSGTLTVADSALSDNAATCDGGGIANYGIATLTNSTVSGNSATGDGGGIYTGGSGESTASTNVTDSTLAGNSASNGGGIYNYDGHTTDVSDSTLSGNRASYGGGIVNAPYGALTLTHVTLWDNASTLGAGGVGGLDNGNFASATLVASIVADNAAGLDCGGPGTVTDGGYNLADDGSCLLGATSLSDTPAGLDPAGLQDNGGPTQTIALEPGSAAIDHVTQAADCTGNDQRGVPWPTPCDIGAIGAPTTLSVSPSTVAPGGKVVLTFSCFSADASVVLHVDSATGTVLGTFKMNSSGGLTTRQEMVQSTYKPGTYKLYAVGGGDTAEATINLT